MSSIQCLIFLVFGHDTFIVRKTGNSRGVPLQPPCSLNITKKDTSCSCKLLHQSNSFVSLLVCKAEQAPGGGGLFHTEGGVIPLLQAKSRHWMTSIKYSWPEHHPCHGMRDSCRAGRLHKRDALYNTCRSSKCSGARTAVTRALSAARGHQSPVTSHQVNTMQTVSVLYLLATCFGPDIYRLQSVNAIYSRLNLNLF